MKVVSSTCDVLALHTEAKLATQGGFIEVLTMESFAPFCCSQYLTFLLVLVV